jgi:peptidoglycan/LPS O-acetylase OafA/YrhL
MQRRGDVHRNSFDLVRLFLATAVIVGHSWGLLGLPNPLGGTGEIGQIAVCGFFSLSGYLVSQSWRRTRNIGFFWNRFLRLAPGYTVSFWVSVVLVGAIGAASARDYLGSLDWRSTWRFFLEFHGPGNRPATFPGQAAPVTNGSMWTIQFEVLCYLLTPLLCLSRLATLFVWSAALALAVMIPNEPSTVVAFPRLLAAYASGVLIADLDIQVGRRHIAAAAIAFAALVPFALTWELGVVTAGAVLTIGLGQRASMWQPLDTSYGTYLYAWPIQNLLIRAGISSPFLLLGATIPLAWLAGWISWVVVERYPLSFKASSGALRPGHDSVVLTAGAPR